MSDTVAGNHTPSDEALAVMVQQAEAVRRVEEACEADGEPPGAAGMLARHVLALAAEVRATRRPGGAVGQWGQCAPVALAWAGACGGFETRGGFGGGGREIWVVGEQQSAVAHVTRRHDDAGPPEAVAAHIAAILNAAGGHGPRPTECAACDNYTVCPREEALSESGCEEKPMSDNPTDPTDPTEDATARGLVPIFPGGFGGRRGRYPDVLLRPRSPYVEPADGWVAGGTIGDGHGGREEFVIPVCVLPLPSGYQIPLCSTCNRNAATVLVVTPSPDEDCGVYPACNDCRPVLNAPKAQEGKDGNHFLMTLDDDRLICEHCHKAGQRVCFASASYVNVDERACGLDACPNCGAQARVKQ